MSTLSPRRDFLAFASLAGTGAILSSLGRTANAAMPELAPRGAAWTSVLDHGVVGDGTTKNTTALQRLIDRLAAAGGGTAYFPPGRYLTGALHLRSNLTLHLEAGAKLQFSADFADYLPMVPSRWQGVPVNNFSPLLYAYRAHNIAIVGRGEIDGAGPAWWDYVLKVRKEARDTGRAPISRWTEAFQAANPPAPGESQRQEAHGFLRPSLFQAIECENVLLAGVTLRDSPFWTTHFVTCDNVVADGLSLYAADSPNTDGINPESSRNVRIANCRFHVSDDCITLKAGKGQWAREHARPCENITITNCVMTEGAAAIGIGSEMSGGVRRVTISNCVFEGTHSGIHIKANRGRGGVVEDIAISNIVMHGITASPAIHLNLEYWIQTKPEAFNAGTPQFRNIAISQVRGTRLKKGVEITGLAESPIRDVRLSQLDLEATEALSATCVDGLRISESRLVARKGAPIVCTASRRLELRGVDTHTASTGEPHLRLADVREAAIAGCAPLSSERPLAAISGATTRAIRFSADNGPCAASIQVAPEVAPTEIIRPT